MKRSLCNASLPLDKCHGLDQLVVKAQMGYTIRYPAGQKGRVAKWVRAHEARPQEAAGQLVRNEKKVKRY